MSTPAARLDRLLIALASEGRSASEIAAEAGITPMKLSRLRHGVGTMAPQIAERLARVLNVAPAWLLGEPAKAP